MSDKPDYIRVTAVTPPSPVLDLRLSHQIFHTYAAPNIYVTCQRDFPPNIVESTITVSISHA